MPCGPDEAEGASASCSADDSIETPVKGAKNGQMVKATERSHDGMVVLDQIGDAKFCLTNLVTAERRQLPAGEWELLCKIDSGEGIVFETSGESESWCAS